MRACPRTEQENVVKQTLFSALDMVLHEQTGCSNMMNPAGGKAAAAVPSRLFYRRCDILL